MTLTGPGFGVSGVGSDADGTWIRGSQEWAVMLTGPGFGVSGVGSDADETWIRGLRSGQ